VELATRKASSADDTITSGMLNPDWGEL